MQKVIKSITVIVCQYHNNLQDNFGRNSMHAQLYLLRGNFYFLIPFCTKCFQKVHWKFFPILFPELK